MMDPTAIRRRRKQQNDRLNQSASITSSLSVLLVIFFCCYFSVVVQGDPISNPYIPYRTSPFDQEGYIDHEIQFPTDDQRRSRIFHSGTTQHDQCPLHFSLGISKRWHDVNAAGGQPTDGTSASAIHHPPILRTVFPAAGPGKQVIYLTQYEHLDLLSPAVYEHKEGRAVQEALLQAPQFPMLWESSSFHGSPILHDVNGDGITDVIVADYDGGISVMGLAQEPGKTRYFRHVQTPRLHVRRNWLESRILKEINHTAIVEGGDEHDKHRDPYHSYFEYYLSDHNDEEQQILRGITANVLDQDESAVKSLQQRRGRRVSHLDDVKPEIEPDEQVHAQEHNHVDASKNEEDMEQHRIELAEELQKRHQEHLTEHGGGGEGTTARESSEEILRARLEGHYHAEQSPNPNHNHAGAADVDSNTHSENHADGQTDHHHENEIPQTESHAEESHQVGETNNDQNNDPGQAEHHPEEHNNIQEHGPETNPNENNQQQEQQQHSEEHANDQQGGGDHTPEHLHAENSPDNEQVHQEEQQHVHDHHETAHHPESENYEPQPVVEQTGEQQQQQQQQQDEPEHSTTEQKNDNVVEVEARPEESHQHEEVAVDSQEERVMHENGGNIEHHPNEGGNVEQPTDHVHEEGANNVDATNHQETNPEHVPDAEPHHSEETQQQGHSEEEKNGATEHHPQNGGEENHGETKEVNAEESRSRRRRLEDLVGDDFVGLADDGLLEEGHTGDDMFPRVDDLDSSADREAMEEEEQERLPYDDFLDTPDITDDMAYGRNKHDDEFRRYSGYDDLYGDYHHDDYYDDKHYIRIPPHILSTPVLVEIPRLYGDNEIDDILLVAASYYFDEDEYEGRFSYKRFSGSDHGDETELKRGMYVASAILAYNFDHNGRWASHTHLDLSTDFSSPENVTLVGAVPIKADVTEMGAFALATPTVADIDGDGTPDVLLGTSMGMLYAIECRNLFKKPNWPIQMKHPIESRPLVEDVLGDTNLEVFVVDTGGIVACFSHEAKLIWSRDILKSLGFGDAISAASPMTLGDVNGDGYMDLVLTVEVDGRWLIFAFQASNGDDLKNFPIEMEKLRKPAKFKEKDRSESRRTLAQPLLVDLHTNQDHVLDYIRRNKQGFQQEITKNDAAKGEYPQGGSSPGLHIVQPLEKQLYIVEGGSGCTQKVAIGDEISTMVQVDDIHGTNHLDLLVATEEGNVITLESSANFHPLNTWNGGSVHGKNSHAHGYSASQGIFVHEVSRQFGDIFGVYVPITFEIFDNRPNIEDEPEKRVYNVEVRDGSSSKRALHRLQLQQPGIYTERVYIRFGPGYYTLCVLMSTSHGITYEDCFATGYNVHFMAGFGVMLWLPLVIAFAAIFLCGVSKKGNWDDENSADDDEELRDNRNLGILGRALPT